MFGGNANVNSRKRKSVEEEEEDAGFLNLSLSLRPSSAPVPVSVPVSAANPPPPVTHNRGSRQPRSRRGAAADGEKGDTIEPPFPWATNRRATVHSMAYLAASGIHAISGAVQCKKCDVKFDLEFDLRQKFAEIWTLIAKNKISMCERAPAFWLNPDLPKCKHCGEDNCVKPVIPEDKDAINWLFLLLGQLLGCCTLEQLKYFCKHTENHRTGAKDRVLYLAYLGVCKQLDPSGPFDRKN